MNVDLKVQSSMLLMSENITPQAAKKNSVLSITKEKVIENQAQGKEEDDKKISAPEKHKEKQDETSGGKKEIDKNFSFLNYYISGDMSSPTAVLYSSEMLGSVESKVRTHEMQHAQALGKYATAVIFGQRLGPDGESYIVSGGVKVDTSEESTPEATMEKMDIIKRAAFAPGDASFRDFLLAARCVYIKQQAIMRQVMETFIDGGFHQDSGFKTEA
jgi:hypothetical protein